MSNAWKQLPNAAQYLPSLAAAEDQFAIPRDLLARVAYQESRWRDDIVSGEFISSAGCVGLMQLNPKFFPGVGKDWRADVLTAARELVRLHSVFHDWHLAVAAYNWGQGNLQHYLAGEIHALPAETASYVAKVFGDVSVPGAMPSALQTLNA